MYTMLPLDYLIYLFRIKEASTNVGQYLIALVMLRILNPELTIELPYAVMGLIACIAAVFFTFTYNSVCDTLEDSVDAKSSKGVSSLSRYELDLLDKFYKLSLLIGVSLSVHIRSYALLGYIILGFIYSTKRIKLKARPMLELISNGFSPSLIFLAGYLQFSDIDYVGLLYATLLFFVVAGSYIVHCLEDRDKDMTAGIKNLSYYLGFNYSVRLSIVLTLIALLMFLSLTTILQALLPISIFYVSGILILVKLHQSENMKYINSFRNNGRLAGLLLFVVLLFYLSV